MTIAFPSVWVACVVWGDRAVRWHAERRPAEREPVDLGPDPADTVGKAALLVSAAMLDAATAEGLDEPTDGSALLDLALPAVSALLTGAYDETITGLLERTRPDFSATEQVLENLRELWGLHAGVEELNQRRRVQRLAHTILVGHQVAGMRLGADPADYLTGRSVVRLRNRLDDFAPWEQERRARAWAEDLAAQLGGDDR
ncbi:hypothetical protein [Kitasatospora sp. NPDC056531]|uniref:hypothetical protein n=1 Tax=Kitasatospora sp. NPDC056531 TaxID=3345856 RepID=UPI00367D44C1